MKRFSVALVLLAIIAATVTGCAPKGSVEFSMDLAPLLETRAMARATITKVTVVLTRTGYNTVTTDLSVSNSVATGRVDNLAPGYWHVTVTVFDALTTLFTGERDIEVLAGMVQQYTILVDPGTNPPTTGSISFSVGLNPVPGYKPLYQLVSNMAMDTQGGKLYILDATTNKIGVYNANTMNREKDLNVAQAPSAMRLSEDGTALLLGYTTGKVFSMNVTTGVSTLLTDFTMPVRQLLPFAGKYLLAMGDGTYTYTTVTKVWSSETGTIVDTLSFDAAYAPLEFNPVNSTIYYRDSSELCRLRVNQVTGDVTYSYTYTSSSLPLRVILNGTRLITGNGAMYTCSDLDAQDLISAGNLGCSYIDLVNDDVNSHLYFITALSPYRLCAMDHSDLLIKNFVDLKGTPRYLFQTATSLIVIVEEAGKFYAKTWAKTDFGL